MKSQLLSLDSAVNRFFVKLFRTSSIEIVKQCQEYFDFKILSVFLTNRVNKFENKLKTLIICYVNTFCNLLADDYCCVYVVSVCLLCLFCVLYMCSTYCYHYVVNKDKKREQMALDRSCYERFCRPSYTCYLRQP